MYKFWKPTKKYCQIKCNIFSCKWQTYRFPFSSWYSWARSSWSACVACGPGGRGGTRRTCSPTGPPCWPCPHTRTFPSELPQNTGTKRHYTQNSQTNKSINKSFPFSKLSVFLELAFKTEWFIRMSFQNWMEYSNKFSKMNRFLESAFKTEWVLRMSF